MNERLESAQAYVDGMNRYRERCTKAASAERTPKLAAPPGALALGTGSLPVSSAEVFQQAEQLGFNAWLAEQYAVTNPVTPESGERSARHGKILRLCEAVLRRHAASMNKRQPEENDPGQPHGK